ncbi:tyrosine-type recombinase/integrase [Halobaculum sp. D14]|uniref:tyrosine-type recombinase/integrase n=1 Tax=Halobaculum sp. D14 TaxID=3421642 RepID=UPI003EBD2481
MSLNGPNRLSRCTIFRDHEWDNGRHIIIVPQSHQQYLTEKQAVDYYEHRKAFLTWLLNFGKNKQRAKGYSPYTVYNTGYRTAEFDLWSWKQNGRYDVPPTQADVTGFMEEVALSDVADSTKGKKLEALRRYSGWLQDYHGEDEWEFAWKFKSGGGNNQPRDFLSVRERRQIRQAALNAEGSPKHGVESLEDTDFEDGSWKVTSLVWTSLDAGLRPVEVRRARCSWVDTENGVLRIPREDSAKNEGNWTVGLTDRTSTGLERWIRERETHPRYEESDRLWLTRRGNPYSAKALRQLLHRLCEQAGIDTENRSMSWYTIRHSVGTYMTKERDLAAAKAQLRHRNAQTTMKYDQVPVEDRRDALDRMG